MTRKWKLAALALPLMGAGVALLTPARAADHLDGPRTEGDPAADITDIYSFMSPETATNVVFIMDVAPFAGASSQFSDKVDYDFDIKPVTMPTVPKLLDGTGLGPAVTIQCNYAATGGGTMTCKGPNGLSVSAKLGDTTGGTSADGGVAGTKLFAGPRSDPFFFDLDAFNKTVMGKLADAASPIAFTNPGTNKFAGANVLSIVLEVNSVSMFGANAILSVAAHTNRTGM